jgi:GT2 family glycosyltransferase
LVSLIVPTRNRADLLGPCLDGLMNKTAYQPIEIIVVDHQSDEARTLALLKRVSADPRVRIMRYEGSFNFSAMNNRAVELARGELVALVNNDIEVIAPDWLTEMVALAAQPEAGAVGAKLLYPNGRVQHAGVGLGIGGVAGHLFCGVAADQAGYFGRLQLASNVSAVTAACLVVKRSVYLEVGGLNELDLRVAFNDVDFCLKLREKGYRNVWTPFATLVHHESPSRGRDTTPEKAARFRSEIDWMTKTWGDALTQDPYLNPNISLNSATFDLAFPPRRVRRWRGADAEAERKRQQRST